jgi:signal transduction histidine kinase
LGSGDKTTRNRLSREYSQALEEHLTHGSRASLAPATKLGRRAKASGLDSVDLAKMHGRTLSGILPSSGNGSGVAGRAGHFLVEALSTIDGHRPTPRKPPSRGQGKALAAANRRAERETGRRVAAEKALQRIERHYRLLLKESVHMQEHLRHLSRRVLTAQEEERKQISRELHDEIGQTLTGVTVKLATLKKEGAENTKGLEKKIASTQRLLERSMRIVHRFARDLRPPLLDDLGLIPALHAFMKEFTKRTHIAVSFTAFAAVERLESEKRTVLYRVAQEALTNVAKHARASRAGVTIRKDGGHVQLEVHDDGRAFQVKRVLSATKFTRLGLLGMRERVEMVGGDFNIESAPGEGTTALLLMMNIFLLLAAYYLLKVIREPLVLSEGGAEVKSYSSAGQALLLLIIVPAYGAFASRVNRVQLIQWVTLFFAANLLLFVLALSAGFRIGDHTITHPYLTRLSDAGGPPGWRAAPECGTPSRGGERTASEQHESLPGLHFRDVWPWR